MVIGQILAKLTRLEFFILLHFLIHIDVFMLCRKFELISTECFQVMAIKKTIQFLKNTLYYCFFFQKMAPKSPPFYITFSDTY